MNIRVMQNTCSNCFMVTIAGCPKNRVLYIDLIFLYPIL